MQLKEIYEEIADSWSNFRTKPVSFLPKKLKGKIIDVGCGNARNIIPFAKNGLFCVGADFSKGMIKNALKMCEKSNVEAEFVLADAAELPFKDKSFDSCISIATLHHLNPRKNRVKSLKEMKRICKGSVYVSVWYRWQFYHLKNLLKNILHFGDVYVDWKIKGKVLKRYYHLYTKKELQKDAEESGLIVESIKIIEENKKKNLLLHGRSR
jgi:ubiquinone/menaquinone biosynthesis C-methylase UbiE